MTASPAGTKAGSDRGGVVNEVPSGKPLESPNINANNTPPRIQPSHARKSSTGGSHDCDTRSSYLNPSQKSSIPSPERSSLRRFSLLPQPVEPICLHRNSLAVEPVRNLGHKLPSPRGQLNRIHTTSRHSLHRPILSSPLTEVAFSSTNTSSSSLTKCDPDMPERPKFKPSRISSSPEIPSVADSIQRPRGSRASSYTSPRRPSSITSFASSSSTLDVASPPESSAAAAPQPRPRTRPRPSTHRTRYSYTNNPYLTHPQSNKRPIWSPNHKPFYDRYPPPSNPRLSTSLYRNSTQSLGSRPPPFHPIPPALDSIRRSHSLNSSNASLQPNSNQRPSSHPGTPAPTKAKEPLTADEHWNLAHAFAFTPRFSRLGLNGEGVILPVHAKDFRGARRNTMKSNENRNPVSGDARSVRQHIPPRPSSAPPSAPPVATAPPTTGSSPRKPRPNKLRKSRPPSLSRPATPRNPLAPQTNADPKVPVKRAASEKVNKPQVKPGGDSVQRSQSLNVSGTSRRPIPNPNQRHRSYSGTSTPVKSKEPLTADEHWNLAHAFAFTPRFSRLGLEAEGVIMPIHAKDFRRTRRNTVANGHPSRSVRQPTTSRLQPTPQPVATPITAIPSPAPSPARRPRPNKLRKSRPPSLASSAPSRNSSILLANANAKDTVKGATEALNKEVAESEVTRGELQTEKDTQDYVVQNSASCPSIRVFSADDRRDSVVSSDDGASSYFTTPSGSSSLFQSSSRSSSSSVLEFTTRTPDSLAVEEVVVVPSDGLSINTLTPPKTPDSLAVEEDVALSSDAPSAPPLCERSPSPPASLSSVRSLASPTYPPHALPQRDSVPPSPLVDLPSLRSLPSIPGVNDTLDAEKKVTPQTDANKTGLMRRFTLRLKSLKRNNAAREKVRPNQGPEQSDRKVDQESPELPTVVRPPSSRKLRKRRRPTPSVLAH